MGECLGQSSGVLVQQVWGRPWPPARHYWVEGSVSCWCSVLDRTARRWRHLLLRWCAPSTSHPQIYRHLYPQVHQFLKSIYSFPGFCGGSNSKESACNAGDSVSGRYPGEGNGYPLYYSCLGNPMDRRSLVGYSTWGHKQLDTTV